MSEVVPPILTAEQFAEEAATLDSHVEMSWKAGAAMALLAHDEALRAGVTELETALAALVETVDRIDPGWMSDEHNDALDAALDPARAVLAAAPTKGQIA